MSRQRSLHLLVFISLLSVMCMFCYNVAFWRQQVSLTSKLFETFYKSKHEASLNSKLNGTFYKPRQPVTPTSKFIGTFHKSREQASPTSKSNGTFYKSRQVASLNIKLNGTFYKSRQESSHPSSKLNGTFYKSSPKPFGNLKWMESDIVNPFPYRFPISPNKACSNKTIDLLIAVPSSRSNSENRQAIRDTWGLYAKDPTSNAILLFFLGSSSGNEKPDVQKNIDAEFSRYGDIVQSDCVDSYANLPVKSISILKWLDDFCQETKYLIKADDDVYVVLPRFLDALRKEDELLHHKPFIFGFRFLKKRPIRDQKKKWFISLNQFKDNVYPNYAAGAAYAMSGNTARLILQAALRTPLFVLEDIYLTGICAKKAGVVVVNNYLHTNNKPVFDNCHFLKLNIIGHKLDEELLHKIHQIFRDGSEMCPLSDVR